MSNPPQNLLPRGFFAAPPVPPPPRRQEEAPHGIHYDYSNSHHVGAVPHPRNSSTASHHPLELPQKRQREEPPPFHCDACSLSLESRSALQAHLASHTRCAQCAFVAAPKVVKAHFEATHGRFAGSGFKTVTVAVPGCPVQRFRICVGNNPEDVRKWIEDRKRRFPRQAARSQSQVPEQSEGREAQQNEPKGLSSLLEGYSSSDSEASESCERKTPATTEPASFLKITSSDDAGLQRPVTEVDTKKRGICRFFARDGKCRNGDNCGFLHETARARPAMWIQSNKRDRTKDTLLGKLLMNDIKRESSLTIQLLDYIVKSDFLEKKLP